MIHCSHAGKQYTKYIQTTDVHKQSLLIDDRSEFNVPKTLYYLVLGSHPSRPLLDACLTDTDKSDESSRLTVIFSAAYPMLPKSLDVFDAADTVFLSW